MLAITPIEIDQTAVLGTWSFNTTRFSGADMRQIFIVAEHTTTTFDVTITDEKDNDVYTSEHNTGSLNELLYLPLRGIYTISVDTSSDLDDTYAGRIMIEE